MNTKIAYLQLVVADFVLLPFPIFHDEHSSVHEAIQLLLKKKKPFCIVIFTRNASQPFSAPSGSFFFNKICLGLSCTSKSKAICKMLNIIGKPIH